MKLILEFDEFKNRESSTRTKNIEEAEFLSLLKEKCKNFSFNNDLLVRGNSNIKTPFGLFISKKRPKGVSFPDWFDELENDIDNYPVVRNNSLIGLGGDTWASMCKAAKLLGNSSGENKLYMVIPFDNTPIIFAPVMDLELLKRADINIPVKGNSGRSRFIDRILTKEHFVKTEYSINFKVPLLEIGKIQREINATKWSGNGYEFWTNGPCLLLEVEKIDWLKENI